MNERDALRTALRKNPKMARMLRKMVQKGQLKPPDNDPNEPLMVICKRWPGLMDDCRMALCSFCGAEVALAPSSQEMIDANKAETNYCCMECFNEGKVEKYKAEQEAKEAAEKASEEAAGEKLAEEGES
jgi:hypothetical protein